MVPSSDPEVAPPSTGIDGEKPSGLAQRFVAFAGSGDPGLADELFTEDFVAHTVFGPMRGARTYAQMVALFPQAFPDAQLTLLQAVTTATFQVVRFRTMGTHTGEGLPGVGPTGQRLHMIETHVQRLHDGRIRADYVSQGNFNLARLLFGLPLDEHDPTLES